MSDTVSTQPRKALPGESLPILSKAEKIAREHGYFSDLAENISLGIIIVDLLKERLVAMNKSAEKMFHHTVKPIDFSAIFQMFFKSKGDSQLNLQWYVPNAQETQYGSRHFGYTIHPMAGGIMGLFVQDITRKNRYQELSENRVFVDMVDQLFMGVRDVIEDPLTGLRQLLGELRDQLNSPEQEKVRQKLDHALTRIGEMDHFTQSLDDFLGYQNIRLRSVELGAYLQRFVALLERFLKRRSIHMQTILPEGNIYASIDPEHFKRALFNIIANAIDAVDSCEEPLISLSLYENGDRVTIAIEDNGYGVPPLLQDKLFYPFYTSKIDALGLGLTISRKIIAGFNGTVAVHSIRKVGTVVEINLPAGQKPLKSLPE